MPYKYYLWFLVADKFNNIIVFIASVADGGDVFEASDMEPPSDSGGIAGKRTYNM